MEIEITSLLDEDRFAFAHSQAEGGENAGRNTWQAALDGPRPLLTTPEQFEALRDHVRGFGAWSEEEIEAWDENECQAIFLQMIAGDVRECPAILDGVEFEEAGVDYENGAGWFFCTEKSKENNEEYGPFSSRSEAYKAACDELVGMHQIRRAQSLDEIDWQEYQDDESTGGRLFRAEDGKIYYSLDS